MVSADKTDDLNNKTEQLTKFIENFEVLKLPFLPANIEKHKIVENKFLDILTDTAGGFNQNNIEGKLLLKLNITILKKYNQKQKLPHNNC